MNLVPSSSAAMTRTDGVAPASCRDGSLRIGNYVVRPDANCWIVARIKTFLTGSRKGQEYESDVVYPRSFDQALKTLLDRLVTDGFEPDTSLEQAVATVAYFYATIGNHGPDA